MLKLLKTPGWQIVSALIVAASLAAGGWYYYHQSNRIIWSMVHVSGDLYSGDAHLLEFPGGHITLIDTGFERFTRRNLIPYLDQRGIDHIDDLIITHAHRNHYGGIKMLLKHLRYINRIYFNLPPKAGCDKETWAAGCDYQHVLDTRKLIEESGVSLQDLTTGKVLYQNADNDIFLKVVYVHDGESKPIGRTDINDTSALLRLVYGDMSVLFTGDVNRKVGKYLVNRNYPLANKIMTAPHHGVDSAASNKFLKRVKAEVFMVSNSAKHWLGKRGERMRKFTVDHDVRTYVTGLHGNVMVTLKRDGFSVDTERKPPRH